MNQQEKDYRSGLDPFLPIDHPAIIRKEHYPLEPLFFKKCVIFGPHMFNFSEITQSLIKEGGAKHVKNKEELITQFKYLISDKGKRQEVGEIGYRFLRNHQGVTERTFKEICLFIN